MLDSRRSESIPRTVRIYSARCKKIRINAVLTINFHRIIIFESGEFVTILIAAKAEKIKLRSGEFSPKKENGKIRKRTLFTVQGAVIAALYVVLTMLASFMGLSSGAIQVRFSEALTVLAWFTPAAIPGLFVGCILSNILSGGILPDVIFGSIATLIGAVLTYLLRKKSPWLAPVPPIVANTLIIPPVLKYFYALDDAVWYLYVTVGIGEIISCGVLGMILFGAIKKKAPKIFGM